jgi:hypothetical protein
MSLYAFARDIPAFHQKTYPKFRMRIDRLPKEFPLAAAHAVDPFVSMSSELSYQQFIDGDFLVPFSEVRA